jgi:hypothetical protein
LLFLAQAKFVPVIGVVTSAIALHEPLGAGRVAALIFTLAGVVAGNAVVIRPEVHEQPS